MRVLKFGGASVKDAEGFRNLADILTRFNDQPLVIVLSAMGKTTNALEEILGTYLENGHYQSRLKELKESHLKVVNELFENPETVNELIEELFLDMECRLERQPSSGYDYLYDQVVPLGEMLSTKILHYYLQSTGLKNRWIDARNFLITYPIHREARLDWETTVPLIGKKLHGMALENPIITQGFIGSTKENITTTLGREGSDFTAGILAYALDAKEVTIWKDVPGVLNADPERFDNTVKFEELSYQDAIEMTYYGARVIHPKTIKPLQNKNIPLRVRSFVDLKEEGTLIHKDAGPIEEAPVMVIKENQVMFEISTKDFSFIAEENLSRIFEAMAHYRFKTNVMQNSAISFAFCTDYDETKTQGFIKMLEKEFNLYHTTSLNLLTLRPYDEEQANDLLSDRDIYLEQRNSRTVQYVYG